MIKKYIYTKSCNQRCFRDVQPTSLTQGGRCRSMHMQATPSDPLQQPARATQAGRCHIMPAEFDKPRRFVSHYLMCIDRERQGGGRGGDEVCVHSDGSEVRSDDPLSKSICVTSLRGYKSSTRRVNKNKRGTLVKSLRGIRHSGFFFFFFYHPIQLPFFLFSFSVTYLFSFFIHPLGLSFPFQLASSVFSRDPTLHASSRIMHRYTSRDI